MKTLLCFFLVAAIAQSYAEDDSHREQRYFSLFNVVKFKNDGCLGTNGEVGTCMKKSDCSSHGGDVIGNCASGFGVCCQFTVSSCGTTVKKNCTVIQNPSYPSLETKAGSCSHTFDRICDDLCQIRLDFQSVQMAIEPTGECIDTLVVTSPTQKNPPVVCGRLDGQHMYLDTSNTGNGGSIAFTYATGESMRYKIKVTFYECTNLAKAPEGCVQYFTGLGNTFKNYGKNDEVMIHEMQYRTCMRQELGYCNMDVSVVGNAPTTNPSFMLGGAAPVGTAQTTECTISYIVLPNTNPAVAMNCGDKLDSESGSALNGRLRGRSAPFFVDTFSGATTEMEKGYNLMYYMVPC